MHTIQTPHRAARRSAAVLIGACAACSLLLGAAATAVAQSGGPYDLSWATVDGGGAAVAAGGSYAVGATVGQPDASRHTGGAYVLAGGFWAASAIATAVPDDTPEEAVRPFALHAAAPNPFNPRTAIAFDLPAASHVELTVYDLRGRAVRQLVSGELPSGHHVRHWNGRDDGGRAVASGTYVFVIDAGEHHARQKGLLVK